MHVFHSTPFRIMAAGLLLSTITLCNAFAEEEDTRDVVRDTHEHVVTTMQYGNCVRTKWDIGHDPCAPAAAMKASELTKEERTVYFAFNRAEITTDQQQKLDSVTGVLKSDVQVRDVRIVGYADRIGSPSYNMQLSELRARNVENYLHRHGYLNTSLARVRWLGESEPITHCPNTLKRKQLIACLQKDRRVEIEIDYYPPAQPQ